MFNVCTSSVVHNYWIYVSVWFAIDCWGICCTITMVWLVVEINVMLNLLMYESFIKMECLCVKQERGVGLHLSLDYLRNIFFFFVSIWCRDFDQLLQCNQTSWLLLNLVNSRDLLVILDFFFLKTWICVCSVLTFGVTISSQKTLNYLGLCMTVQYLLNCRMIMLPHFPTLCFSVELLTLISFALQVLLF